ncbi:hypothetical protein WJX74_010234 [Apatococcus lobatus]|uniref:Uncharacterized protein n=1 Tax=Apatococcus lobatus TaxID=904363 RepID=A0AAW1RFJ5_9CHLO
MSQRVKIQPIDKNTVHRICSGQVILDLATAVKELLENSLDAGASNIELRLKEYGSELIEVADNGHGLSPDNYESATLKYCTSKINTFSDLQALGTFGFRGEALSSLCAMSKLSIITRTAEQSTAVRLTYNANGSLASTEATARAAGTTVAVQDLFKPLAVRHKEFKRSIKREYAKLICVLQAYAMISTGVRLVCTNQAGSAARTTVVSTQSNNAILQNITTVFGSKASDTLRPFHAEAGESAHITGFVTKAGVSSGRAGGDRQFFFLNGRPVDMPKASKIINEMFRSLASPAAAGSRPMAVLDFHLPKDSYDVNVTPDKRQAFLQQEGMLLESLRQELSKLWEPSRSTYDVQDTVGSSQSQAAIVRRKRISQGSSLPTHMEDEFENHPIAEESQGLDENALHPQEPTAGAGSPVPLLAFGRPSSSGGVKPQKRMLLAFEGPGKKPRTSLPKQATLSHLIPRLHPSNASGSQQHLNDQSPPAAPFLVPTDSPGPSDCKSHVTTPGILPDMGDNTTSPPARASTAAAPATSTQDTDEELAGGQCSSSMLEDKPMHIPSSGPLADASSSDPLAAAAFVATAIQDEAACSQSESEPQLSCSLSMMRQRLQKRRSSRLRAASSNGQRHAFAAASLQAEGSDRGLDSEQAAENELERVFNKANFSSMEVLGQFNLGFIVARLADDLFILDQHACDEKYNFERLQRETVLNRQPLLIPQPLDLSPSETVLLRVHQPSLQANGFEVKELDAGQLALTSVPFSRFTVFGVSDIQELLTLLEQHGSSTQPQGMTCEASHSAAQRWGTNVVRPSSRTSGRPEENDGMLKYAWM